MNPAGRPASAQLRKLLSSAEQNPARRDRLFARFWHPRAAVVDGLTGVVLDFVSREWNSLRGALVLDYGCGVMPYREAFDSAGAQVIGADIGRNNDAQIEIPVHGRLPVSDCTCDYVVSFQVLEHVPVPHDYLREAQRVLKPGGKLLLTSHGLWPYHPTPGDYHRWTKDGLVAELERAGFRTESTGHILNEYSAAVQNVVMTGHYRGAWRWLTSAVHLLAYVAILLLERICKHEPQLPAVVWVIGVKT